MVENVENKGIKILITCILPYGLSRWLSGKESTSQCRRHGSGSWVKKILWRRNGHPMPVFLPGKSHGQRSLAGHSQWGHKRVGHNLGTKQQQTYHIITITIYVCIYFLSFFFLCMLLLSCFSRVQLCATPETAAHQALPSLGFSWQEHWSGLPFPSPVHESEK